MPFNGTWENVLDLGRVDDDNFFLALKEKSDKKNKFALNEMSLPTTVLIRTLVSFLFARYSTQKITELLDFMTTFSVR